MSFEVALKGGIGVAGTQHGEKFRDKIDKHEDNIESSGRDARWQSRFWDGTFFIAYFARTPVSADRRSSADRTRACKMGSAAFHAESTRR